MKRMVVESGEEQVALIRRMLSERKVPDPDRFVTLRGGRAVVFKRSPFGGPSGSVSLGVKAGVKAVGDPLGLPSVARLQELVAARGMPWKEEYAQRVVPYFGSDERVDQMGDIVRQDWDFSEFEKNSPMPYSHDWNMPPVGKVISWEVVKRNEKDYKGPALFLLGLFATGYEWAETIFRLAQARVLNSGSVGFYAGRVIDIKDEEERAKLGLGKWGLIFENCHLLEFSPTTIPANPGAVIPRILEEQKSLRPNDIQLLRELARLTIRGREHDLAEWASFENDILRLARSIWPEHQDMFRFHKELDFPVTLTEPVLREPPPPPPPPSEDEQGETPPEEAPKKPDPMTLLVETHAATISMAKQVGEMYAKIMADKGEEEPPAEKPPEGGKEEEGKKIPPLGQLRAELDRLIQKS